MDPNAAFAGAAPVKAEKPTHQHMVLTTSRLMGPEGKSLARGRIVRVPVKRIGKLVKAGHARTATAEEVKAATLPIVDLA